MLYARLVAGIEAVPEDTSARVEGLELLCSFIDGGTGPLKGQCGDHRLIVALTALFFVSACPQGGLYCCSRHAHAWQS